MSGNDLSGKVQVNMVSNPPTDSLTAHTKAWDNIGLAIVAEMLLALHAASIDPCGGGAVTLIPVNAASISAAGLKTAILTAISGTSGVTPGNAHVKYWDGIGGAIVTYYTTNLKLQTIVSGGGVGHTYTPSFNGKTGYDLGSDIRTAIFGVSGVSPTNAHDLYWTAITTAIDTFVKANYFSLANPAVGGIGSTQIISIS